MQFFSSKFRKNIFVLMLVTASIFYSRQKAEAGTLSCTNRVSACNAGEVSVLGLYDIANSHAELAGQGNYNNLVCCTGVTGLSNICSGTYATVAKLSSSTNAHIEQNSQINYANNACLSVPSGGTITVGYQETNCSGYDTTVASMNAATNGHAGISSTYSTKICASATGGTGSVSVDIVDSGGVSVSSPTIPFPNSNFWWASQQSTGVLGSSSQKIRVSSSGLPSWTISLAATSGPTAIWQSGSNTYDFNGTSTAGRMQVNAGSATITPQNGCTNTGISAGATTYFSQGTQDSITLLSGSASQSNCYWDLTGVNMIQDLPALQPTGNYSLQMTLTAA